ncbi:MAG TPA: peroxiredoxin [Desulfurivibrio alkaliphilus]|uniref:Peroxiredoxin n=1 Tax=Desulfurivibrio alkaliphilus TaxID=427923 RepID=A0A7C2THF7_9BACT|nr:peroxiredoxin [Desulfurivibrio alkaliphilus]
MAKSLGIFVTNPDNMQHILGVTKAAKAKGAKVKVFFTWMGTKLSKDPAFPQLVEMADDVSICVDSYKNMGYEVSDVPTGLTPDKMATQAQHGAIIEGYDRYLTL